MAGTPEDAHLIGELVREHPWGMAWIVFLTVVAGGLGALWAITGEGKNGDEP